jgi:hypothetical protein
MVSPPGLFTIKTSDDWVALRRQGADAVLDPMVVRTAHLFLLGPTGTKKPAEVWSVLQNNIGALATFVDALVLHDRIPVFNYGDSGFSKTHDRPEPSELLNACGDVLIPVHISLADVPFAQEYTNIVAEAAKEVGGHPDLPLELVSEIAEQLTAYDFAWEPSGSLLHPVGFRSFSGPDTEIGWVLRYLRGCLVFTGFAQLLGDEREAEGLPARPAEHVTPPSFSRLYAAAGLRIEPDDEAFHAESVLFARLAAAGNADEVGIGRTVEFEQPTFLPYLLDDEAISTPAELFHRAISLRQDKSVRDYIAFRRRIRDELRDGHPETYLQEIDELVAAARAAVAKTPHRWPVTLKGSLSAPKGLSASIEGQKEVDLWRPFAWAMRQLPGKGHRKLLLRLLIAQHETSLLRNLVRKRWAAVA